MQIFPNSGLFHETKNLVSWILGWDPRILGIQENCVSPIFPRPKTQESKNLISWTQEIRPKNFFLDATKIFENLEGPRRDVFTPPQASPTMLAILCTSSPIHNYYGRSRCSMEIVRFSVGEGEKCMRLCAETLSTLGCALACTQHCVLFELSCFRNV